jgi:hypothetical protein
MIKKNVFLVLMITLLFSLQIIYAEDAPTISFPKKVTVVDTPIYVTLYVYNPNSTEQTYSLVSYTSPYESYFSEDKITLKSSESKEVTLIISPQENVLDSTYKASIELMYLQNSKKIEFEIIQKANRSCPIDLQHTIVYVKESGNYRLDLFFNNSSKKDQELDVIGIKDINLEYPIGVVIVPSDVETKMVRVFKTDLKETKIEYRCNGVYGYVTLELPKKETDKSKVQVISVFTGLVSFTKSINLTTIFNSIIFQIILIIILIIVILSFSTKYIKYVYRK